MKFILKPVTRDKHGKFEVNRHYGHFEEAKK